MKKAELKRGSPKTKIPKHAKCVFKGILFDVYHWEQEQFDGSFKTFEAVKRIPSVQIIATTKDDKIILLNEEQPYVGKFISVPGGQVERDYTPEQSAKEELLEELGMRAEELAFWREETFGSKIDWSSYYYIAKKCKKIQEPQLEIGERIEPYELSFKEFLEEVQRDDFRNKALANIILKIKDNPRELEEFKRMVFE